MRKADFNEFLMLVEWMKEYPGKRAIRIEFSDGDEEDEYIFDEDSLRAWLWTAQAENRDIIVQAVEI